VGAGLITLGPARGRRPWHGTLECMSFPPRGPRSASSHLRKAYQDVVAVDVWTSRSGSPSAFGLLGPNGAGKTTTIEICEGLTDPDSGEVELLGMRWSTHAAELRQRLGIQLQDTSFPISSPFSNRTPLPKLFPARAVGIESHRPGATGGEERLARGRPLRRPEAASGAGLRAGRGPGVPVPRRTHHRARPAGPPPALGSDRASQSGRPDHSAHHALYGRSRAPVPARGPSWTMER